jgi:AraC-like DNA-binding protein
MGGGGRGMSPRAPSRVLRHDGDGMAWELAYGTPSPQVAPYIRELCGFWEITSVPMLRREFPESHFVMVIEFGPPLAVYGPYNNMERARHSTGYIAGMHDCFAVTESVGSMRGLQVNFTPLGARLFFDLPLHELFRRVISIDDILGAEGPRLASQLYDINDWDARFTLVEQVIARRIADAKPLSPGVVWAWNQLAATQGRVDIGALAAKLEWSRKHLIAQFHDQVGVAPKLAGRILRFEQAVDRLQADTVTSFAELALDCGYYDQAHLARDLKEFTGLSPRELAKRRLPDGAGFGF